MGFGRADLREITSTAIDAAFCDEGLKRALRARL
jgi:adenosine deaminase